MGYNSSVDDIEIKEDIHWRNSMAASSSVWAVKISFLTIAGSGLGIRDVGRQQSMIASLAKDYEGVFETVGAAVKFGVTQIIFPSSYR